LNEDSIVVFDELWILSGYPTSYLSLTVASGNAREAWEAGFSIIVLQAYPYKLVAA